MDTASAAGAVTLASQSAATSGGNASGNSQHGLEEPPRPSFEEFWQRNKEVHKRRRIKFAPNVGLEDPRPLFFLLRISDPLFILAGSFFGGEGGTQQKKWKIEEAMEEVRFGLAAARPHPLA
ncbi:hypothetical protein BX600DRAFT_431982 [Xylariales sp. PMI_506]|nr:hypothetical protein BX600DRAFT_431982 [Xylariales sp. PMI_506]